MIVALSGGVGGAKLALGLAHVVEPSALTVVANTGDDFEHLGLYVSPDLDSILYALAGVVNPATGWGRADETWSFLEALERLGGETWFRLGDRDLAVHVERTHRLAGGASLSDVTTHLATALGVRARLVPMCDAPVRTVVLGPAGELPFQRWFVERRCEPAVTGFRYDGAHAARPSPGFEAALADPALEAVVICPSNPFVSTGPILAVPGVVERLQAGRVPIVGVSPLVGGAAVKGPLAKMMRELGMAVTSLEVARLYLERGTLDAFVVDHEDAHEAAGIARLGVRLHVTNTVMNTLEERIALGREVVGLAREMAR